LIPRVGEKQNVITAVQEHLGNYLADFSSFEKSATGRELPWLRRLREDGFTQFAEVGFPTTEIEDWRFTNVSPIARTEFRLVRDESHLASLREVARYYMEDAVPSLVFVNGHFSPALSRLSALPEGIVARSLAEQMATDPRKLEPHLGRYLDMKWDVFGALNTAFLEDGAFISIPRGAIVEAPIHLLFVSGGEPFPVVSHPRNLVVVEEGAEATLVEEYVSLPGLVAFCNAATEVVASDDAVVSHYRIERDNPETFHISMLRVQQNRNTNVASHSVLLGAALVRNNVHPVLEGEGGECLINGLFLGSGSEHLDNYMLVEHVGPHAGSRQFYNGILDGQARGVFHGRIIVHKQAQKTDAKQTNRNLLLSDGAQIDTKPQLEIFADDVKCTHGATIGQIDDNALFYLRARGFGELSARRMLLRAFAGECLDRMKEGPARRRVEELIEARVSQMAATLTERTGRFVGEQSERSREVVQ
jgi:Fe-S cluster assembly protein SufD